MKKISDLSSISIAVVQGISVEVLNSFFEPLLIEFTRALSHYNQNNNVEPLIDFDHFKGSVEVIIDSLDDDQVKAVRRVGYNNKPISLGEWRKNESYKALTVFLDIFPEYSNILKNCHLPASIAIKAAAWHLGAEISSKNFIQAKKLISQFNTDRWIRPQTPSESQSGVSNLGAISEGLLEKALENRIDGSNFFKITNNNVQSYGDFVLMCLPNNLWLSVKSNFARERLLASGYTTDILGVGFFTNFEEFTSRSKIRNFQRVGFLAMYLPDMPVDEKQEANNTNTYDQVVNDYNEKNAPLPLNINGTPFLRKLSDLDDDLKSLMSVEDISKRTTLSF